MGESFEAWRRRRESLVAGKAGWSSLGVICHDGVVGCYVLPAGEGSPGVLSRPASPREIGAARRRVCEALAAMMRGDGHGVAGGDVLADPAWRTRSGNPRCLNFPFDPAEPGGVAAVVAALRSYFEGATDDSE